MRNRTSALDHGEKTDPPHTNLTNGGVVKKHSSACPQRSHESANQTQSVRDVTATQILALEVLNHHTDWHATLTTECRASIFELLPCDGGDLNSLLEILLIQVVLVRGKNGMTSSSF